MRIIGAVLAVAAVAVLAGCGSSTAGPTAASPAPWGTPIPFHLKAGGTETITPTGFVAPGVPAQYQPAATAGDDYVGIEFAVANTGSTNVVADLAGMTALTDQSGRSFSPVFVTLSNCPSAGVLPTVAPGAQTATCVVFEAPRGDGVGEVSVGSAGLRPGIWSLAGA